MQKSSIVNFPLSSKYVSEQDSLVSSTFIQVFFLHLAFFKKNIKKLPLRFQETF